MDKYYDCSIDGFNWHTFLSKSRGQAKSAYIKKIDMDIPYTKVRAIISTYFPPLSDQFKPQLKVGDKVVMHTCLESNIPEYNGKIWHCLTDSYIDKSKQEVVFLKGFSGCFIVDYLQKIDITSISEVVLIQLNP